MSSGDSKSSSHGLLVENLSKSFGRQRVVSNMTLRITAERTTALIGPSGCGKTTLLKLMIGLHWPDSGTVSFASEALTRENVLRLRKNVGYVIQNGGLFPHLTALDNITLMARHLDWSKASMESRLEIMLALTQFPADALQRFPAQLSGGQQQRVGLMRALMLDPEYLLLDEPLAALDPMVRADMQRDLKQIFRQLKKTVVLVTHDLNEAAYFSDQLVLVHGGEVAQKGTKRELLEHPASEFVERFVQAQNFLSGSQV